MTKLAAVITRNEPPLDRQVTAALAAGAELVELRVDSIGDLPAIETLLRRPRDIPFILTVRPTNEGGQWDGDESERISLIERLGLLLPGYIDVELSTWNRSANVRQKIELVCRTRAGSAANAESERARSEDRPRNELILSHHDFRGTPADLGVLFDELADSPAEIIKAAFMARDATDALRVLAELHSRSTSRRIIALAMGEAGLLSRVLAKKFSAFLSFAAMSNGDSSAPGQPTIEQLQALYRWRHIGPQTRVFGVIGWPVTHSRGPHIHNAAMSADGIDGVYVPMPVAPTYEAFASFMDYVTGNPWLDIHGLSVTLPHKENALRWLDEHGGTVEDDARRIGAINTLAWSPSENLSTSLNSNVAAESNWNGFNTDAPGAIDALQALDLLRGSLLDGRSVDVLGAGGAARAIVAATVNHGCRVTVFNRTPERSQKIAHEFGCASRPWDERDGGDSEILINCTTIGLWPHHNASPISAEALRPERIVFDTIYNPPETRLLREARERGCQTISGVEMFLGQARRQYEMWHGRSAPTGVIRAAFDRAAQA